MKSEKEHDLIPQGQIDSEANLLSSHELVLGVHEVSAVLVIVLSDPLKRLSNVGPGGELFIQDIGEGALGLALVDVCPLTEERRKSQHPAAKEVAGIRIVHFRSRPGHVDFPLQWREVLQRPQGFQACEEPMQVVAVVIAVPDVDIGVVLLKAIGRSLDWGTGCRLKERRTRLRRRR